MWLQGSYIITANRDDVKLEPLWKYWRDISGRLATALVGSNSVVLVYDDERGLHADYEEWLDELAPHEPISRYRHNRTGEDNGDAYLKRQVIGREVVLAITDGQLDFGTWERIFYGEFDGGRRKPVLV